MKPLTAEWVQKAEDDFTVKTLKVSFAIQNTFQAWLGCKFSLSICEKDL